MINVYVRQLINYGLRTGLIPPEDEVFCINRIIEALGLYEYEEPQSVEPEELEKILEGILNFAVNSEFTQFIVATESGILHEMQKRCPEKTFIPAPPEDGTCSCNECSYMKLNTLQKLYNTLKYELPEVSVDKAIADKAIVPIERMLEISKQLGLVK